MSDKGLAELETRIAALSTKLDQLLWMIWFALGGLLAIGVRLVTMGGTTG